jgi:hypothetical protein
LGEFTEMDVLLSAMVAAGEINARTGDGGEVLFSSKPL